MAMKFRVHYWSGGISKSVDVEADTPQKARNQVIEQARNKGQTAIIEKIKAVRKQDA